MVTKELLKAHNAYLSQVNPEQVKRLVERLILSLQKKSPVKKGNKENQQLEANKKELLLNAIQIKEEEGIGQHLVDLNIGFETALDGTGKKREFLMSSTLRDISSTFKDVNAMLLENEDECMPSPLNQISSVEEDEVIDIDNPDDLAAKGLRRIMIDGEDEEFLMDLEGNIYDLQGNFIG